MNQVPDVVGLLLEDAIKRLEPTFNVSIHKTKAPKFTEKTRECRVIRQNNTHKSIELIISDF